MRSIDVATDGYLCSPLSVASSGYFCINVIADAESWHEVVKFTLAFVRKMSFILER